MPDAIRQRFSYCRVIVDCIKVFASTPSSIANKSLLYREYTIHMIFQRLIVISPAGVTTFVSDLWGGSISDKQLTNNRISRFV